MSNVSSRKSSNVICILVVHVSVLSFVKISIKLNVVRNLEKNRYDVLLKKNNFFWCC